MSRRREIYALERIARESGRDHWPIMEVLTAYLRANRPISATPGDLPPEARAILRAIARRNTAFDFENQLDLERTDLNDAILSAATLTNADLRSAILPGATLSDANGLSQLQLDEACGNENTVLPEGLTVPQCGAAP